MEEPVDNSDHEDETSDDITVITAIDKTSIHKICSGQVILTLGTALKELLENSVDAGATSVEIRVRGFGAQMIEVVDNGSGVEPSNFAGLGLKHHTSKLRAFSDLSNMETFGFRGEALSSLCSLGNLSVHTRHKKDSVGSRLEFNSLGDLAKTEISPRQVGTTVTVTDLFHSLPVRHREFLKNIKKEYAKMIGILQGYALVLTGVRVCLFNISEKSGKDAKQLVFSTNGNQSLKENILNIFGFKQLQSLNELSQHAPTDDVASDFGLKDLKEDLKEDDIDFELDGFVSSAEHGKGRSSADRQFFFINGRPCDSSKVFRLINDVYRQYNRHQTPFIALRVRAKRDTIDINVTPNKRQMFMEKEKLFLATLKTSLIKLFETQVNLYNTNSLIHCSAKLGLPLDGTIIFPDYKKEKREEVKGISVGKTSTPQSSLRRFAFSRASPSSSSSSASHNDDGDGERASFSRKDTTNSTTPTLVESPLARLRRGVEERKRARKVEDEDEEVNWPVKIRRTNQEDGEKKNFEDEALELFFTPPSKRDQDSSLFGRRDFVKTKDTAPGDRSRSDDYEIDRPMEKDHRRSVASLNFDLNSIERKIRGIQIKSADEEIRHSAFRAKIDPSKNEEAEEELRREISKDKFARMTILGQFNLGFIVVKLDEDLFIIDQHATDEKYNFETLQRDTIIRSQKLIIPQRLDLSPANEIVLEENLEVFAKNGFKFDFDPKAPGGERVKLSSVPISKDWNFGHSDVEEMLFMLSELTPGTLCRPSRVRKMFASRACRKSVMIGTALNRSEMRQIVDHMATLDHPWNCPHGRPTMRHLVNLAILPD